VAPEMLKVNKKGEAITPQKGGKNEAVNLGYAMGLTFRIIKDMI
jgi:hypothetical protein